MNTKISKVLSSSWTILFAAILASVGSFLVFYNQNMTTAFLDSRARLMIARRVVDGIHTGLPQLGGVWPPLPQLAMLPFIGNDTLYSTGIAGVVFPMFCFILSMVLIFKFGKALTGDAGAALLGTLAFASPNLLFMQAVPMSESPFICFLLMCTYYLFRWSQEPDKVGYLVLSSLGFTLGAMVRYELWPYYAAIIIVFLYTTWHRPHLFRDKGKRQSFFVFYSTLALFGPLLMLLFNLIINGDALYSFGGNEYSPWAIVSSKLHLLPDAHRTDGKLFFSAYVYAKTSLDNMGPGVAVLAMIGFVLALLGFVRGFFGVASAWASKRQPSTNSLTAVSGGRLVLFSLIFPFVLYMYLLYKGTSVAIHHPDIVPGANWGTRYGTFMLVWAGVFIAYLMARKPLVLKFAVFGVIFVNSLYVALGPNPIISSGEAVVNRDNPRAVAHREAGAWLNTNYTWDLGPLVLMQRFNNEQMVFESGLPQVKLIYEGDQDFWTDSLDNPVAMQVDYIVFTDDENDVVGNSLRGTEVLLSNYHLVYAEGGVEIWYINQPGQQ